MVESERRMMGFAYFTSDVSDEVLETAAKNEALPAWTWVCSGISCPG
jgi:hypothetical protein